VAGCEEDSAVTIIEYHQVQVSFIIDYDEYSNYAIPQTISGP